MYEKIQCLHIMNPTTTTSDVQKDVITNSLKLQGLVKYNGRCTVGRRKVAKHSPVNMKSKE